MCCGGEGDVEIEIIETLPPRRYTKPRVYPDAMRTATLPCSPRTSRTGRFRSCETLDYAPRPSHHLRNPPSEFHCGERDHPAHSAEWSYISCHPRLPSRVVLRSPRPGHSSSPSTSLSSSYSLTPPRTVSCHCHYTRSSSSSSPRSSMSDSFVNSGQRVHTPAPTWGTPGITRRYEEDMIPQQRTRRVRFED